MAVEVWSLAWFAPLPKPAEKIVLLKLSDAAHADGRNAYPSVRTIARQCCIDPRTVQRSLHALCDDHWIAVQARPSQHRPTTYMVNLTKLEEAKAAYFRGDTTPPLRVVRGDTVSPLNDSADHSGVARVQVRGGMAASRGDISPGTTPPDPDPLDPSRTLPPEKPTGADAPGFVHEEEEDQTPQERAQVSTPDVAQITPVVVGVINDLAGLDTTIDEAELREMVKARCAQVLDDIGPIPYDGRTVAAAIESVRYKLAHGINGYCREAAKPRAVMWARLTAQKARAVRR
jgi:hypothetical protein